MSSRKAYILNKVQNPKLLKLVYKSIRNGNQEKEELVSDTGLEDDRQELLDNALKGLQLLRMVEKNEFKFEVNPAEQFLSTGWNIEFTLTLLHRVAQEAKESDWGRQSVVLLNYEYLLKEDIQYFKSSDRELIENLDQWHKNIGYQPLNSRGSRMELNKVKFSHWTNLAEFLGLLHKVRGSEYTLAPDLSLLKTAITQSIDQAGSRDGIQLNTFVEWINDNLIRIPLTAEKNFPKPISRSLYALAKKGQVELVKSGDAPTVELTETQPPIKSHPNIAKDANFIRTIG
jgi:hypothetical protein